MMNVPEIRFKGFEGEWQTVFLKDVCQINPHADLPEVFEYVDLESVVGTVMNSHRIEYKDTAPSRAQRLAKYGDIFFQTVRPYQKNNYLFKLREENYVFSTGYAQLRTKYDSGYLFNIIQSPAFLKQVLINCSGSNYPAINPSSLSKIEFSISEFIKEQNFLAFYFNMIDNFIKLSNAKILSLKQTKAACLQSMFPKEGETVPKVRFKGFEGEWEKRSLNDIFIERHEISTITESLPQLSFTIAEGIIRPEDRKSNKRDFLIKDKENKKYLVTKKGDIIYNPANVVFGAIHQNSLCNGVVSPIYKIFETNQDSCFMECIVRNPLFITKLSMRTEGTVTKLKTLSPESFLKMNVMIAPSYAEQQKIGQFFHSLDKKISLETQSLEKLKHIKAACLDKMFV